MFDLINPVTRRFLSAAVLILGVYCMAVPAFMAVEGLNLVDAIYFTTVSMTSVGYGDITPHTTVGKLLTVALLLTAGSIFFYHITHFGQFKEQAIDPHVRKRLDILRSLTSFQTREAKESQIKRIRNRIAGKK
jgi:voltage-gated potassium channel Kch